MEWALAYRSSLGTRQVCTPELSGRWPCTASKVDQTAELWGPQRKGHGRQGIRLASGWGGLGQVRGMRLGWAQQVGVGSWGLAREEGPHPQSGQEMGPLVSDALEAAGGMCWPGRGERKRQTEQQPF